jgi:TIR domain
MKKAIGADLVRPLEDWKQELIDEVISRYRDNDEEHGRLSFDRWKRRFSAFLKQNVPEEGLRFEEEMEHSAWLLLKGESPYENFMREDGRTCIAFIDELADSLRKGRIVSDKIESPSFPKVRAGAPKLFLCYAREDVISARELYTGLKKAGADVWFDKVNLLPGQRWKQAIRRAVAGARFFVALLSKNSVNKKGYVQKELKEGLEIYDEYPESTIFLIPVRLDDCQPLDDRLDEIHRVDLFPDWEEGVAIILKAIESQL